MPAFSFPQIALRAFAVVALVVGGAVVAQIQGVSRPAPGPSRAGAFEVSGVEVDVIAGSATAARYAGWRLAQRKGWEMLSRRLGAGDTGLSDAALDAIVASIIVENEQIGPTRYIARLGIAFDRGRAASILGVSAGVSRSPPMLLLPLEWSGGAGRSFEQKTEWQAAWARFRTSQSSIDYVRPAGTGPDSLLLNAGQINRPNRSWWRSVLAQYGASDVLIPIVHLYRVWPGGPVIGSFQARHGPDNRLLTNFSLRVNDGDALPELLDAGVKRIDEAYQSALSNGVLRIDPGLLARLPTAEIAAELVDEALLPDEAVGTGAAASAITVQFDTPGASTVDTTQSAMRSVPGVRSVVVTSLALGGISVMRVSYDGDLAALRAALESRGWQVVSGNGAIRILRARQLLPPPNVQPEIATPG